MEAIVPDYSRITRNNQELSLPLKSKDSFGSPQDFPFASRRARQTFHRESCRLQHTPYSSQSVEQGLCPHFRLFFRCEGIEVDDVVGGGKGIRGEVCFYLVQGEIRG